MKLSNMRQQLNLLIGVLLICCVSPFAIAANGNTNDSAAQNSIEAIDISPTSGGNLVMRLRMKQPLANPPAGFTTNNPPRIALDFPNTVNGLGKTTQSGEGDLRSVKIVESGNRTRVIMNLAQVVRYDTQVEGKNLLITLQGGRAPSGTTKATTNVTSHFAEAKLGDQKHSVRDIDFRRGKNGEGRVVIDLSDAATGIDLRQQGKTLIVDLLRTSLPANLQRRLDVTDFATPVQSVDTFAQGDNVRVVVEPKGNWEHSAYQTDNKFILEVKPIQEDPNKLVQTGKPGYHGEKLSLNFQNVEVRAVLQVIADFTGRNIITSDTVSGNLTLRLKDVPWDQALDIILMTKGLDMRVNGNVIWIAPRDELATKEKLELEAKQQIADLEPTRTETFQLNYQKAENFQKILTDDKQRILSKRGSAVIDPRTNTLFIQDTPTKLVEIRQLIKVIDVPVNQVMIEARIVEASDTFARNLGVRLGNVTTHLRQSPGSSSIATTGRLEDFTNLFPKTPPSFTEIPTNQSVNLPAPSINSVPAGSFALRINNSLTGLLFLELSALQADGAGKIISSPRVITADQQEATIEQGTEIPYQQATSSGATSVTFKKATLSLKVKPQITPDDNVIMNLNVHKDSPGQQVPGVGPAIDTKQIETQVLVENGGTVVIGGIYTQEESTTINKVPALGDLPVIGFLFKQTQRVNNKNELLIFITPKIIKETLSIR